MVGLTSIRAGSLQFGKDGRLYAGGTKGFGGPSGPGSPGQIFVIDPLTGAKADAATRAANVAYGARIASYRFDKYLTKENADKKPTLKKLSVITSMDARRSVS